MTADPLQASRTMVDPPRGKIVIHIGTQKTGSTSIQDFCNRGPAIFEEKGCLYPALSPLKNHSILGVPFCGDRMPREFRHLIGDDIDHVRAVARDCWQQIAAQVRDRPEVRTLVLSGEHLVDIVDHAGLRELLAGYFPGWRIKVLCYLRDPASYYLSHLQQQMKASASPAWPEDLHWGKKVLAWQEIGTLTLREFSPETLFRRNVVRDFLARLFDTATAARISLPPRRNESLSMESMEIVRHYRGRAHADRDDLLRPDSMRLVALLQSAEARVPKPATPPKAQLYGRVRDLAIWRNRANLEQLRDAARFTFLNPDLYDFEAIAARLDAEPVATDMPPHLDQIAPIDAGYMALLRSEVLALLLQEDGLQGDGARKSAQAAPS